MPLKRLAALGGAAALAATTLAACDSGEQEGTDDGANAAGSIEEAAAANRSRQVDERFGETPKVLADNDHSGVASSELYFEDSETAIVTGPTLAEQLRGASIAVAAHAPVFRLSEGVESVIAAEIDRLGAGKVLLVGDADIDLGDDVETIEDPGTAEGLTSLTSLQFEERVVSDQGDIAEAVAGLDGQDPQWIRPSWEGLPGQPAPEDEYGAGEESESAESSSPSSAESASASEGEPGEGSFPVQSARDGDAGPITVSHPGSTIADIANARAWGAPVRHLDFPDPRIDEDATKAVAGLSDGPLIALGSEFGTDTSLGRAIELAEDPGEELPGGGHLVFPGRRMIALYGHPSGGALGVMGEQGPEESVQRVNELISQYEQFESEEPIIPAFEIITTIASSEPGPEGKYTNYTEAEELEPYIDAVVDAGGYAVLDLQPGKASFLEQAKAYEDLLKRPNVGLALDPEWRLEDGQEPAAQVGHTTAAEINEVADWLAEFVYENDLPQKAFVVHQFQMQMIRDREDVNTHHPELAYVLHADGHGVPEEKYGTWHAIQEDLDPHWFLAWKNFIDEDQPMFTPEQTYNDVSPRPWFVSYQ